MRSWELKGKGGRFQLKQGFKLTGLYSEVRPDRLNNNSAQNNREIEIDEYYYSTAQRRVQITHEKSTNVLRYCTVIWTVVYFVLLKKNLFNQSAARVTLLYPLCFSRLMRNEQKNLAEKKKAVG